MRDVDEAIRIASRLPSTGVGRIEVKPIRPLVATVDGLRSDEHGRSLRGQMVSHEVAEALGEVNDLF